MIISDPLVCRGSPMITYITLLAHFLVHWYLQCVTVYNVPKCMSYHKAIVVITGRAHCFHDYTHTCDENSYKIKRTIKFFKRKKKTL